MPILPVRDLGSVGVVADVSPYNLPISAFSRGDNVVFKDGKAERAPIFKSVFEEVNNEPLIGAMVSQTEASGVDSFYVCDRNYAVNKWSYPLFTGQINNIYSTMTTGSTNTIPVTGTTLADVVYFNKPDARPIYKLPSETFFRELYPKSFAPNSPTSTWGTSSDVWTCQSLRSYGDFLIALGMTEGGVEKPARVRWCDPVLANEAAIKWDASDTTTLAGFNDLVQLDGGIIDGLSLGNQFVIYSRDQVWLMDFVGGQFVFNFRRLYSDIGIINANCVVEVGGAHFVFGNDDIYTHNGTAKQSIASGKVRDFIFNNMNSNSNHVNFVHHSERFNIIMFCYNSGDSNAKFDHAEHCNKAAVYNYEEGTWSFMDLPNVTASGVGNLSANEITYDEAGAPTYESLGGNYQDSTASFSRQSLFINAVQRIESPSSTTDYPVASADAYHGFTKANLLALDSLTDPRVVAAYQAEQNAGATLERTGIDLDETGQNLRAYKSLTNLYPQMVSASNSSISFSVGAADLPNNAPNYSTVTSFSPSTAYQVNTRAAGRYLSYKVSTTDPESHFAFTGFDADFLMTSKR